MHLPADIFRWPAAGGAPSAVAATRTTQASRPRFAMGLGEPDGHRHPEPEPGRGRIRGRRSAFTLVELLLAVALIALLMGAIAFNFSTLQRGTRLEEGVNQLEALLRYARAHASATGHRVRINFEEDVGDGLFVPLGNLNVTWEADPLLQPETFLPLAEAAPYLGSIQDLISIEDVKPPGEETADVPAAGPAILPAEGDVDPVLLDDGAGFGFAPITFFPDGSSDSAVVTVAARDDDGEDPRRVVLRLVGLTGAIRRRVVVVESPEAAAQPAPKPAASAPASAPAKETPPWEDDEL